MIGEGGVVVRSSFLEADGGGGEWLWGMGGLVWGWGVHWIGEWR